VRIETAASSRVSKQERIGNVAYMRPSWLTEDLLEVNAWARGGSPEVPASTREWIKPVNLI